MRQIMRPLIPAFELLVSAKSIEENEIIEPPGIDGTEAIKTVASKAGGRSDEVASGLEEKRQFVGEDVIVFNRAIVRSQQLELGAVDPAVVGQAFQADQQRVSGEGRSCRVGRVAVADGSN